MIDHLNLHHSEVRIRDLHRQAELWRLGHQGYAGRGRLGPASLSGSVVIRSASRADDAALARLAQLDGHPRLDGAHLLVAEVEGEVLAALPLAGGDPIADPFRPTAPLVEMLKLRAGQLRNGAQPPSGLRARLSRMLGSRSRGPAMAPASPANAGMLIPRD